MAGISTIDEYIAAAPENHREVLQKIRETIHAAAPKAQERISFHMPGFWQGEVLIWFATMKKHIGIYPTNSGIEAFAEQLVAYNPAKGTFRIPYDKPVPYDLIEEITCFRVQEVESKKK